MDFSKKKQNLSENTLEIILPEGLELLDQLVGFTGLPEPAIREELVNIFDHSGHEAKNMTLEELREAMLAYLMLVDAEITGANIASERKS